MVRSNFDYTNRSSSGEKLGSSIAGDLWKKSTQAVKATRSSSKISNGNIVKCIDDTICTAQTRLDIRIPDKILTDAGFRPIAEALLAVVQNRPDLALTELDLSGNSLTAASLPGLYQIVSRSHYLQILNLDNNSITVQSDYDVDDWQQFIEACWSHRYPLKVVLDRNAPLGPLALEVVCRTAFKCQEAAIYDETAPYTATSDDVKQYEGTTRIENGTVNSQRPARILSIHGIGMEELGALYIATAQRNTPSMEFLWSNNPSTLTNDGQSLLNIVEKQIIAGMLFDNDVAIEVPRFDTNPTFGRRTLDDQEEIDSWKTTEEFERLVKRIERNTIVKHGYRKVELWVAAMEVFQVSRSLFMLATPPVRRAMHRKDGHHKVYEPNQKSQGLTEVKNHRPRSEVKRDFETKQQIVTWNMETPKRRYAASVNDRAWPELLPITPTTNSVASKHYEWTPNSSSNKLLRQSKNERLSRGDYIRIETPPTPVASPIQEKKQVVSSVVAAKSLAFQRSRLTSQQSVHGGASDGYRDASLRCQLPLTICRRILEMCLDERMLSVMSCRQQQKAFEWGQVGDSLMTEYGWRTKDKASQLWMLLEAMECLRYE